MKTISLAALSLFFFSSLLAAAQAPPPAPTPAQELKKLDYFVGTWKSVGDLKPGPMGPGGKVTGADHVEWMSGHFFLVFHSNESSPMGRGLGTAFMGYNTDDKNYTFDAFNSMGEAEHATGTVAGDTWTWTSTEKMGGQVMKGRYTVTVVSPTSYNFKFELAPESGDYSTVMEGKATKVTSAGSAKGTAGADTKK
jgi:hypothetical protein